MRYFDGDLFAFLRELKATNDCGWFTTNKARYESSVKAPSSRSSRTPDRICAS